MNSFFDKAGRPARYLKRPSKVGGQDGVRIAGGYGQISTDAKVELKCCSDSFMFASLAEELGTRSGFRLERSWRSPPPVSKSNANPTNPFLIFIASSSMATAAASGRRSELIMGPPPLAGTNRIGRHQPAECDGSTAVLRHPRAETNGAAALRR